MELAKLNDEKKAAAIMQIRDHMKQLLEAYERTRNKTPKDTVELLTEMIGRKACLEAIANLVNIVGDWDGRLSTKCREWAKNVEGSVLRAELMEYCFYQPSEIHPSHIEQITLQAMTADTLWRETGKEAQASKPEEPQTQPRPKRKSRRI